ncbi:hypothetical protein K1719_021226 [Acacia pycnantha]|nr:hypothetical protein K1719_021226 [Acacia pycnantha]
MNIVKKVFPLHDKKKRHKLFKSWAFHWWDFTNQPIDEVYSYFGAKKTLFSSMESLICLMKEVEIQEEAAEQAKIEAALGGSEILINVEELKNMLMHQNGSCSWRI